MLILIDILIKYLSFYLSFKKDRNLVPLIY